MKTITERSEYKGHEILSIVEADGEHPKRVAFGLAKAKMILTQLEAIKAFVAENEKSSIPLPPQ